MKNRRLFAAANMSKKLSDAQKADVLTLVRGGHSLVDAVATVAERPRRIRAVPKSVDASEFMSSWRRSKGVAAKGQGAV